MLLVNTYLLPHVIIHLLHIEKDLAEITIFHVFQERHQLFDSIIYLFVVHIATASSDNWDAVFSLFMSNILQSLPGYECKMNLCMHHVFVCKTSYDFQRQRVLIKQIVIGDSPDRYCHSRHQLQDGKGIFLFYMKNISLIIKKNTKQ